MDSPCEHETGLVAAKANIAPVSMMAAMAMVSSMMRSSLLRASFVGAGQSRNVDLAHLQHGLHDPVRFRVILILQHFAQNRRDNLPRHPEFVFQPAATARFTSGREFLPQLINFVLRPAIDEKGDGFGELELGAAVQGDESFPSR